jgi:hypothetical protein
MVFPEEKIEEVRATADIVDVVGDHVQLRRRLQECAVFQPNRFDVQLGNELVPLHLAVQLNPGFERLGLQGDGSGQLTHLPLGGDPPLLLNAQALLDRHGATE